MISISYHGLVYRSMYIVKLPIISSGVSSFFSDKVKPDRCASIKNY